MTLYLFNSITSTLERFEHDKSIPIKWYTCGPTIYSSAHLGHARTFISFDIVRRVLTYLGYNIIYVMNITDIDDKIINKVKELSSGQVNNTIYMDFIKNMEAEFWSDMDKLNNIRPTIVTRVTEYIEKIKQYIEKMESNGLTYCVNGTVYIDSQKYLERGYNWDIFHRSSTTDYTECEFSSEKKHNSDFSLWKATKPGEIKFDSKWGEGRPSWHIECSVMSHDILGHSINIHSGGIDLIYPHHSNEIIQTISHENCNDMPIKYFLHSGHLNINGEKMAKSLGNFITISNFLEKVGTVRQLRLLFLLHTWNKPMDFTDDVLNEVNLIEKRIIDFYSNMEHAVRVGQKIVTKYSEQDNEYLGFIIKMKQEIELAMCNNIDTRSTMNIILNAINKTYKYTEKEYNVTFINDIVKHITLIFDIFGVSFLDKDSVDKNASEKFIDIVVDLRADVRDVVKKNIKEFPKNIVSDIFKILDDVRDNKLKPNGITIEDFGIGKKNKWTKNIS
jgi:cysteinyl-tRNA synthetase